MRIIWLLLVAITITGCTTIETDAPNTAPTTDNTDRVQVNEQVQFLEDGTPYLVHPDQIRSGGPPKDGIPSIDNPEFITAEEADEWIADDELVIALERGGEVRIYPLQVLVWHEIVNDEVGGEEILITYCPLCGSGIAYKPIVQGEAVEFGTSGKLFNSNLVMYDRKTDTYWSQINGQAILGELAGEELQPVNVDTVVWNNYIQAHPEAQVLSRDTGYERAYGQDPYGNYYENSNLFFPVENQDDRLHPKEVVFGLHVNDEAIAVTQKALQKQETVNAEVGGVQLEISMHASGEVDVIRTDTGEELAKERDFWFAWYTFNPDTQLVTSDGLSQQI